MAVMQHTRRLDPPGLLTGGRRGRGVHAGHQGRRGRGGRGWARGPPGDGRPSATAAGTQRASG